MESGAVVKRGVEPASWSGFWASFSGPSRRAFLICLVGASLANMDQALFAFVLTEISQELGWTIVERGWYIALTFTVAGAGVAGLGSLTDRVGRTRVFRASILVSSLFVTAMRWAPTTAWLLTLRTLGFATGGIQSPVTGTIVIEESPPRYRGLLSGTLQIAYPIGWFIASLLSPPIYEHYGWRYIFFIGLLSIPYAWVVGKYLREPPAYVEARKRRAASRFAELFGPELRFRTFVLFVGEFLHVFAYGATFLLTAYFREARGFEAADAIGLVGLSYAVGSVGYLLAAFVGEFVLTRRDTIIVWSLFGSVAFAAMIWLAESYWATVVSYCAMTIFFYGTTVVKFTFIAESFPTRLRATGITFAGSLAVALGIAFGPLGLSYVIELAGWSWAFTLCGVVPLFVAGLVFCLLPSAPEENGV